MTEYTVWDKDFPVFNSDKLAHCIAYVKRQNKINLVIIRASDNFKFDRVLEKFIE